MTIAARFALILALFLPALALAQTNGNAEELPLGEPVDAEVGQTYERDTYGDWALRCVKTEDGQDPCRLYQLLQDQNGNSVAEMTLFALPEGAVAAAGGTVVTPLETLLTEQITISVDGGQAKRYPFTFCAQVGCVARIGLTQEDVDAFKRGSAASIVIVPLAAPDQKVSLTLSLSGFTAGFEAVAATN